MTKPGFSPHALKQEKHSLYTDAKINSVLLNY